MARSGNPRVSLVVPTHNDARNVARLLPAVEAVRPAIDEIVLADSGADTGTAEAARRVSARAKVVRQTRTGKGNALACGFAAATGEIIVTFGADGTADPAEVPSFVAALLAGADFVTGSRFRAGGRPLAGSLPARGRSTLLNHLARLFFGAAQTDLVYGYHAFWTDVLPALQLPSIAAPAPPDTVPWGDGPEIDTLLSCRAAAAGGRLVEVASVERRPLDGRPVRRTAADDRRVLRVLTAERRRARDGARSTAEPVPDLPAGGR
jgi:hypothetical protein